MCFFSFILFEKNTTVLPLGCTQHNTIGCIHTTMLECKELREIFIHTFEEKKPTKWIKQVKKYMIDLHLSLHTIEYSKHQHIRRRIKEFEDKLLLDNIS